MRIRYISCQRHIRLTTEFIPSKFSLCPLACLLPTVYCLLLLVTTPAFSTPRGWAATYGGVDYDEAYSIRQTKDGGYIVVGETRSFGAGEPDIWVLKLNHDGTVEWQKTYGGDDCDRAHSIQQTHDGGYIVAGGTASFGAGNDDFWVLKLRSTGTVAWQKTYGGADWDNAYSIQQTSDGGYIVAGGTTGSFGAGGERIPDIWVLKLGLDGTVEWEKTYGRGNSFDRTDSIQQTSDGGYIVAGWTGNVDSGTGTLGVWGAVAWIIKLRPDGTVEWQKTYGGGKGDEAHSIQQTSDGGYIVAGEADSFGAGWEDFWVLKLKPDGSINPSCNFIGDFSVSGKDSNATILDSHASVRDSNVKPQDTSTVSRTSDASANILCP